MSSPTSSEQDYAVRYLYLEFLAALKEKYLATFEHFTYVLPFALSGRTDSSLNNALKAKMEFALYAHLQPVSHSARPLICPGVCFACSDTLGGSHSESSCSNSENWACGWRAEGRLQVCVEHQTVASSRCSSAENRLDEAVKTTAGWPLQLGGRRCLSSSTPDRALRSKNHSGNEVRAERDGSSRPEVLPAM